MNREFLIVQIALNLKAFICSEVNSLDMKAFLNDLKIAVHVPWRGIDVCGQPFKVVSIEFRLV